MSCNYVFRLPRDICIVGRYDENSLKKNTSESHASETYPALNSIQILKDNMEWESDEIKSEEVDLDESTIAKDDNNEAIYVMVVVKWDTTKTGKRKKSDRVYSSTNPWPICKKQHVTNFYHLRKKTWYTDFFSFCNVVGDSTVVKCL